MVEGITERVKAVDAKEKGVSTVSAKSANHEAGGASLNAARTTAESMKEKIEQKAALVSLVGSVL